MPTNPTRNAYAGDTGSDPTKGASYFRSAVVVDFVSNPVAYLNQTIEDKEFKGTMREALVGQSATDTKMKSNIWKLKTSSHALINQMPRNSVIARPLPSEGSALAPEIFFPFFPPHISLPVSAGEHIWVMYDGGIGYWICRKSTTLQVDDINYTHHDRGELELGYEDDPGLDPILGGKANPSSGQWPFVFNEGGQGNASNVTLKGEDPYEKILESSLSYATDFTGEAVPRFSKRSGDLILQGGNNTLISLGQEIGTGNPEINNATIRGTPRPPGLDRSIFGKLKSLTDGLSLGSESFDTLKSPEVVKLASTQGMGAIDIVVGRGRSKETAPVGYDPEKPNDKNVGKRPDAYSSLQYEEVDKAPERTSEKHSNPNEGNPDLVNDLSRIYLSMKSRIDLDLKIDDNIAISNTAGKVEDIKSEFDKPTILLRTDQARIMAREDLKITVGEGGAAVVIKASGDIIFIPGPKGFIKLGGSSADRAILCTGKPASQDNGSTNGTKPIGTNSGGQFGDLSNVTEISGGGLEVFGSFASKVLVVGNI